MRKIEVIYNKHETKLVEEINKIYQKAEKLGYQIMSNQIIKEPCSGFYSFIEYETRPLKK